MSTTQDRLAIYVAGPYSSDPVKGVRAAIEAADRIWEAGGVPYVPHLTHLWHLISPKCYDEWIEMGLAWVGRCDALLRLPGPSPGADEEAEHARDIECIPVHYSIGASIAFINEHVEGTLARHLKQCREICEWCNEQWPIHRVLNCDLPTGVHGSTCYSWTHTQAAELTDGTINEFHLCRATLLRREYDRRTIKKGTWQ